MHAVPCLVVTFAGWFGVPKYADPLHDAARTGNVVRAAVALLRNPTAVNAQEQRTKAYFPTAVHTAAYWNKVGALELLLARGGKTHYPGRTGDNGEPDESPLQYAAKNNSREAAEALLRHGAPLDIFSAVALDKWDEVRRCFLLARGFGLHERLANAWSRRTWGSRQSLLNWAVDGGSYRMVELLLDNGADPNPYPEPRVVLTNTPLHVAVWARRLDLAALLLDRGARIDAQNADGYTPLHWAVLHGDAAGVLFLLARGARTDVPIDWHCPRACDSNEPLTFFTPLHTAAKHADPVMVALLLAYGANPNARAAVPRPTGVYTREDEKALARPEARAARGRTPLDVAATVPDVWDREAFAHKPGRLTAWRVLCTVFVGAAGGVPGNPRP